MMQKKVLIDVGTGYLIEKTMEEGKDYCGRIINLLKASYDHFLEVTSKKKIIADEAALVLQGKLIGFIVADSSDLYL
ncbi:putative prefoldin alpha [Helianthus annuus]|nr:putative prefoldin alpha [Helianthus annuus]